MSILIKGMEMPKNCEECMFAYFDDVDFDYVLYCTANEKYADLDMYDHPMGWNCPLIELPPHGRLADLDKIIEDYWDGNHMEIDENDLKAISKYKVIIESERGKANDTH